MAKLIRCECGFVARGDNDDQVVGWSGSTWPPTIRPCWPPSASRTCSAGSRPNSRLALKRRQREQSRPDTADQPEVIAALTPGGRPCCDWRAEDHA